VIYPGWQSFSIQGVEDIKKPPRAERGLTAGGGGSKVGNVGQTMIREKMSRLYLFKFSDLIRCNSDPEQVAAMQYPE